MKKLLRLNLAVSVLIAIVLAAGLVFFVSQPGELQVMSASGDIFRLEDGEGNEVFAIDDDGALSQSGGLVDIGGGSYDTADGDNDLGVAGDLEVDGELELDGALDADSTANFADTVTFAGAVIELAGDLTEDTTLTASDCGKTSFLNATTEFSTTLPALSTVSAGCSFRFIVKAAPSGDSYNIFTGNSKENQLIGGINELEVDTSDDGPYDTDADHIAFADGVAAVGDYVYMISDGTSWYLEGQANADGGITLAQDD